MTWKEDLLKFYCAMRYLVVVVLMVALAVVAGLLDKFSLKETDQ